MRDPRQIRPVEYPDARENAGFKSLAKNVAFQLRLAQSASFQAFTERAREPGLQPGRYALLQLIGDTPGIGQTVLSQAVGRDKSTLTPTLANLEQRGLIARAVDPEDRRGRCLTLTKTGKAMLSRLARHARAHDNRINRILGPERETLLRLLGVLIRGLDHTHKDEE